MESDFEEEPLELRGQLRVLCVLSGVAMRFKFRSIFILDGEDANCSRCLSAILAMQPAQPEPVSPLTSQMPGCLSAMYMMCKG